MPTASNRQRLASLLADLPSALTKARAGAAERIREAALRAGGLAALEIIKAAFVVKSRGGMDEAGVQWQPLSPKTIAYGRRHPGLARRRKSALEKGRAGRPLLTDRLDALWRRIFAGTLRGLEAAGDPAARGKAAAKAWRVVKAAGGQTILGRYGGIAVEIGRDTGRLFASLSPGAADNLLEIAANVVAVGTNVEYAGAFHGKRPLWPERWPDVWADHVADMMAQAITLALTQELAT
jgi:hypothetical protein